MSYYNPKRIKRNEKNSHRLTQKNTDTKLYVSYSPFIFSVYSVCSVGPIISIIRGRPCSSVAKK